MSRGCGILPRAQLPATCWKPACIRMMQHHCCSWLQQADCILHHTTCALKALLLDACCAFLRLAFLLLPALLPPFLLHRWPTDCSLHNTRCRTAGVPIGVSRACCGGGVARCVHTVHAPRLIHTLPDAGGAAPPRCHARSTRGLCWCVDPCVDTSRAKLALGAVLRTGQDRYPVRRGEHARLTAPS